MAIPITMPRQGQSVESCVILEWFKKKGESVTEGDILFSYETDKASFECESPASGTLLEIFFQAEADVPVLTNVGVIGTPGEDASPFKPNTTGAAQTQTPAAPPDPPVVSKTAPQAPPSQMASVSPNEGFVSPRAKNMAAQKGVDINQLTGSGPKGRVIARDIEKAVASGTGLLTLGARAVMAAGETSAPAAGFGIGGRVRTHDLLTGDVSQIHTVPLENTFTEVKMTNIRKLIARRMHESLSQSAQLTMHASANAERMIDFRKQMKQMTETLKLPKITITDLVAFALSRVLPRFPDVNALLSDDKIIQYDNVHLAMAVDTPRGLMVPVIPFANQRTLLELSTEIKNAARQCQDGTIPPDRLQGGTITISNLGLFGIEYFTPVLNPPQVALLGVNAILPKPTITDKEESVIKPHLGLSLTIDHRALDGAPAARFLKALSTAIENIDVYLAL